MVKLLPLPRGPCSLPPDSPRNAPSAEKADLNGLESEPRASPMAKLGVFRVSWKSASIWCHGSPCWRKFVSFGSSGKTDAGGWGELGPVPAVALPIRGHPKWPRDVVVEKRPPLPWTPP